MTVTRFTGTDVAGPIVPGSPAERFATHYAKLGAGFCPEISTFSAINEELPSDEILHPDGLGCGRRRLNSIIYVVDTKQYYRLFDSEYTELNDAEKLSFLKDANNFLPYSFGNMSDDDIIYAVRNSQYFVENTDPRISYVHPTYNNGFTIGIRNDAESFIQTSEPVAIGMGNQIRQYQGLAIGIDNQSINVVDYAIGIRNIASGGRSMAVGIDNQTSGGRTLAFGANNLVQGAYSICIGEGNQTNASRQVIIGNNYFAPVDSPTRVFMPKIRLYEAGATAELAAPDGTIHSISFNNAGQLLIDGVIFNPGASGGVDLSDYYKRSESDNRYLNQVVKISNVVNSDYVLTIDDAFKLIPVNSNTLKTITIPSNSDVQFKIGTLIEISQDGIGQVEIVSNAFLQFFGGKKTAGQYASVHLLKIAENIWRISNGIE